ncbi:MAG: serine/threonine protein kinase [Planctomycetes bacterium]|nr:serine/threonine protein kinase [Planctomycetota bacterium]
MSSNWPEVRKIVNAALDQPPEKRQAYAKQACGNDAALSEAVWSLLNDDSVPEGFLEPPIEGAAVHLASGSADRAAAIEHMGRYRVTGVIDSGGAGTVYRAVPSDDENAPPVAVKVLKRGMTGEDMQQRFRQEREVLARLKHRNIARFIDGGVTSGGLPYLVMEFIEGRPIDRFCDQQKLPVNDRLELFEDVCSAVQYSHRNLVVHRDLKPRNILVTDDGVPKLLDFGIAKLLEDGSSGLAADPTVTANRMITPQYASPEQIKGVPISTATDVYSLGVVLYELLTGHRPYDLRGKARGEILELIGQADPTSPSTQVMQTEEVTCLDGSTTTLTPELVSMARGTDPQSLRRELTGDLDTIVLTAMHKDPDRRYASVERLAEDIRRCRTGLPILARADSFGYRARKFIRRNKAATIAATVALVSLIGGTTGLAFGLQQAHRTRVLLVGQTNAARREAQKAERVNKFLQELLAATDPWRSQQDPSIKELLDKASERVDREFRDELEIRAALHRTMGLAYSRLTAYDKAAPHLHAALELRRELDSRSEYAESLHDMGELLRLEGKLEEAESMHREALDLRRTTEGESGAAIAESLNDLALTLKARGKYKAAEALYEEAVQHYAIHREESIQEYPIALHNLGSLLVLKADYAAAEAHYVEAIQFAEENWAQSDPLIAILFKGYADLLASSGAYDLAEDHYRRALVIHRNLQSAPVDHLASTLTDLGSLLRKKGEYDKAEPLLREGLEIRRRILGEEHPSVAHSLNALGVLHSKLGYFAKALQDYEGALGIYRRVLGDNGMRIGNLLHNMGVVHQRMNDYDLAEQRFLEALRIWTGKLGAEHPKLAQALTGLGVIRLEQADYAGAEHFFRRALSIRRDNLPGDHPALASSLRVLGAALSKQSKAEEAEPLLRESLQICRLKFAVNHWRTAMAESSLASSLISLERYDEAESLLLHSYAILKKAKGEQANATEAARKRIVLLYDSTGRPEQAAEYRVLLEAATDDDESEDGGAKPASDAKKEPAQDPDEVPPAPSSAEGGERESP